MQLLKQATLIALMLFTLNLIGQDKTALDWQAQMNKEFADSADSPLKEEDRLSFTGLDFFEIDTTYKVLATLSLTPDSVPFAMATTTGRKARYRQYAWVTFSLKGDTFALPIYQNLRLIGKEGYNDYLFLPFKDNTNGSQSYGGGRYIDLAIPLEGSELVIDFNKAYNPYCAYNDRYSCPIPPKENYLDFAVNAGVMAPKKH